MQRIQYTCDWCGRVMEAECANRLEIAPARVPFKYAADMEASTPMERAERKLSAMEAHYQRDRQGMTADICDMCYGQLREWLRSRTKPGR